MEPTRSALRKDQSKVQQEGRRESPGHDAGPLHFKVEGIELAAVLEGIEDKGPQAEDVKMHGARRIPPAHENEKPNEKIEETNKPAVILDGSRLLRRRGDDWSFKLATVAGQFVAHLGPHPGVPQATSNLDLRGDWSVVDSDQQVAWADTGASSGGVGSEFPSLSAAGGIQPGHAIIRGLKSLALDEVQPGKAQRCQRGKRQNDRSETDTQILFHDPSTVYPPPVNLRCKPMSNVPATMAPRTAMSS